jgi:hypothetical protein
VVQGIEWRVATGQNRPDAKSGTPAISREKETALNESESV